MPGCTTSPSSPAARLVIPPPSPKVLVLGDMRERIPSSALPLPHPPLPPSALPKMAPPPFPPPVVSGAHLIPIQRHAALEFSRALVAVACPDDSNGCFLERTADLELRSCFAPRNVSCLPGFDSAIVYSSPSSSPPLLLHTGGARW